MPPNNILLQKRYALIIKKFDEMSGELVLEQVRKYTHDDIVKQLSEEFCYSEKTIENICTVKRTTM